MKFSVASNTDEKLGREREKKKKKIEEKQVRKTKRGRERERWVERMEQKGDTEGTTRTTQGRLAPR